MDRSIARVRYARHKKDAASRGIAFEMSFEEWCAIWEPEWDRRGVHKDQLGMCRTRDQGGYKVGNVRLDTPKGNAGDRVLMRRRPWQKKFMDESCGPDIDVVANRFLRPDEALELAQEGE